MKKHTHRHPPPSLPSYSQETTSQSRPQNAPPHQPAPGTGDPRGISPLRCAPAGPPPPFSLPRAALTSGGRLSAGAGRGTLPLSLGVFLCRAVPSRCEPRRLCLPRHSSPPAPRRRLPAMRSEGRRREAKGRDAKRCPAAGPAWGRLSRHRPAPLPAGAAQGRHNAPQRRSPVASFCLPLQHSPAVLGAHSDPQGTPQRAAAFSGFDTLCPPLSFGKLLGGRGTGRLCGWEQSTCTSAQQRPT